jgi:hypothetical protein
MIDAKCKMFLLTDPNSLPKEVMAEVLKVKSPELPRKNKRKASSQALVR